MMADESEIARLRLMLEDAAREFARADELPEAERAAVVLCQTAEEYAEVLGAASAPMSDPTPLANSACPKCENKLWRTIFWIACERCGYRRRRN